MIVRPEPAGHAESGAVFGRTITAGAAGAPPDGGDHGVCSDKSPRTCCTHHGHRCRDHDHRSRSAGKGTTAVGRTCGRRPCTWIWRRASTATVVSVPAPEPAPAGRHGVKRAPRTAIPRHERRYPPPTATPATRDGSAGPRPRGVNPRHRDMAPRPQTPTPPSPILPGRPGPKSPPSESGSSTTPRSTG